MRGLSSALLRPSGVALRSLCTASGSALGAVNKPSDIPTLKLYRDCMRLTYHIAAGSAKGDAMRMMVRQQFKAQMHVTDPQEIDRLKMLGVIGLQNYVIHEQTTKAVDSRKRANSKKPDGGGS